MGWQFDLRHINIVAYLVLGEVKPPRVNMHELRNFLVGIRGEESTRRPLLSSNTAWIAEVAATALEASSLLDQVSSRDGFLDPLRTAEILKGLRKAIGRYALIGLTVGTSEDEKVLTAFAEHAAYSSKDHALFLIPTLPAKQEGFELLDPLPGARKILSRPDQWPGMLFWLGSGASCFAQLKDAYKLYQKMLEAFEEGTARLEAICKEFNLNQRDADSKRVLHLSDLHFGSLKALENQAYLKAHLQSRAPSVDRIVITGDLVDNPTKRDALDFRNFRADLEIRTGRDPIVIPGNHDQKMLGNTLWGFGRRLKQVANLEWSSLVIDDDLQCVFYCFDSSKDATNFAKGRVTKTQLLDVATLFETKAAGRSELRRYLSVALVHHHPYSFQHEGKTLLDKTLLAIHLNQEDFLEMDDAEDFLTWCAGRRIPLILHGHKHVPRHVTQSIRWTHGKDQGWRTVTAAGCGTSVGMEGLPLSYNIHEWLPSTQTWSTSFYADTGTGTGFEEVYVALHSVPPLSA